MASKKLIDAAVILGTTSGSSSPVPKVADFAVSRLAPGGVNMDTSKGIKMTATGTATNTNSLQYLLNPIVAGPNGWRVTAHIHVFTPPCIGLLMGLILRDSVSGKSTSMGIGLDRCTGINTNTFSSDEKWESVAGVASIRNRDLWLRVVDDLTNRAWFISQDCYFWQQIWKVPRSDYILPDQVGLFVNPNAGYSNPGSLQGAEVWMLASAFTFEQL